MSKQRIPSRYFLKKELAQAYFPTSSQQTASRRLRLLIASEPLCEDALRNTHTYKHNQHHLTREQVSIIFQFFGAPKLPSPRPVEEYIKPHRRK